MSEVYSQSCVIMLIIVENPSRCKETRRIYHPIKCGGWTSINPLCNLSFPKFVGSVLKTLYSIYHLLKKYLQQSF